MKAERLKEIRERCECATPGPWEADIICVEGNPAGGAYAQRIRQGKSPFTRSFDVGVCYSEDATFIAHARDDVPFLLAEIERLSSQAPLQVSDEKHNIPAEMSAAYGDDGSLGVLIRNQNHYVYVDVLSDKRIHCYFRDEQGYSEEILSEPVAALATPRGET